MATFYSPQRVRTDIPQEQQTVQAMTQQISGLLEPSQGIPESGGTTPPPTPTSGPAGVIDRLIDRRPRVPRTPRNPNPNNPNPTNPGPNNPNPTTPADPNGIVNPGQNGAPTTTDLSGAPPTPQNASVADQLTSLLDSNSPYMQQARQAGLRVANRRGLLNSSIAAGASEASAIAAAAPIASQDAAQIHQRNQTELEGWTQLRNSTALQDQADRAAFDRLNAELANRIQIQGMSDAAAMQRLIQQGDIETALQEMRNDNALTQTQINANVSLLSNYMSAFATLAQNPELPASARNAYMAEFIRVTTAGQNLVNTLSGTSVTWPTTSAAA